MNEIPSLAQEKETPSEKCGKNYGRSKIFCERKQFIPQKESFIYGQEKRKIIFDFLVYKKYQED